MTQAEIAKHNKNYMEVHVSWPSESEKKVFLNPVCLLSSLLLFMDMITFGKNNQIGMCFCKHYRGPKRKDERGRTEKI